MKEERLPFDTVKLEKRMRPGELSQNGFLGMSESLVVLMEKDDETLRGLKLTHEELAGRLDDLLRLAIASPHRTARVGDFDVMIELFTGFQICPWAEDVHSGQCTIGGGVDYGSLDWCIRNLRTRQKMRGPGLAVHLIRDHHFFEGIESPSRVDPTELARLLNLL